MAKNNGSSWIDEENYPAWDVERRGFGLSLMCVSAWNLRRGKKKNKTFHLFLHPFHINRSPPFLAMDNVPKSFHFEFLNTHTHDTTSIVEKSSLLLSLQVTSDNDIALKVYGLNLKFKFNGS